MQKRIVGANKAKRRAELAHGKMDISTYPRALVQCSFQRCDVVMKFGE